MTKQLACQSNLFEGVGVRTVFHKNELWFSVVDVIRAVKVKKSVSDKSSGTERFDANNYWKVLKHRLFHDEGGCELVTKCNQLKLESSDGKFYKTDCMIEQDIYELLYEIPSKKTRAFKQFSASLVKSFFENRKSSPADERIESTPLTVELNKVVNRIRKPELEQEHFDHHFYSNMENWIHMAVTGMSASHHKKMLSAKNGVDLYSKEELSVVNFIKASLIKQLEKYEPLSLIDEAIKEVIKAVCDTGRKMLGMFEESGLLSFDRHIDILPQSQKKIVMKRSQALLT